MNPKQLKAKYPYMFAGENMGLSIARGWFSIFVKLCEEIDALLGENKRGFHWVYIKEKMGSARLHWDLDRDAEDALEDRAELRTCIRDLVAQATSMTHSHCAVCGEPGRLQHHGGWQLVLCEDHGRQREAGAMESPWFSEGDGL